MTNPYINNNNTSGPLPPPSPPPPPVPNKWSTSLHDDLHMWIFDQEKLSKILEFCAEQRFNDFVFDDVYKIEHERPVFSGWNNAYLYGFIDVLITLGESTGIICELKPRLYSLTNTLNQINKHRACLGTEPKNDQNNPKYASEFWIKRYTTILAVIITYDKNTRFDKFFRTQNIGVYHINEETEV
jgi:hypothetical protein